MPASVTVSVSVQLALCYQENPPTPPGCRETVGQSGFAINLLILSNPSCLLRSRTLDSVHSIMEGSESPVRLDNSDWCRKSPSPVRGEDINEDINNASMSWDIVRVEMMTARLEKRITQFREEHPVAAFFEVRELSDDEFPYPDRHKVSHFDRIQGFLQGDAKIDCDWLVRHGYEILIVRKPRKGHRDSFGYCFKYFLVVRFF